MVRFIELASKRLDVLRGLQKFFTSPQLFGVYRGVSAIE